MSRRIIVSGGARGIGRSLVRNFLEGGNSVYIFDIDEKELDYTTQTHLKQYSDDGKLAASICNLRDANDIREKVKKAAEFHGGRIDVLINCGGIATPYWKDGKTMEDPETLDQWNAYIETNLTAPFIVSQACIPYMKITNESTDLKHLSKGTAGPCILHIGSFRAQISDPNQEGYASSKSGQLGLTKSMAVTCQQWGIRVNLIAPGRIKVAHENQEGEEQGETFEGQHEEKDVEDHLTNRAGRPSDIFQAAEYLIDAGFVTGQDLTVDGGVTLMK